MTCQIGWAELTYLSDSTIVTINSWFCTLYRNLFDRRSPVGKKKFDENKLPFFFFHVYFGLYLFIFF